MIRRPPGIPAPAGVSIKDSAPALSSFGLSVSSSAPRMPLDTLAERHGLRLDPRLPPRVPGEGRLMVLMFQAGRTLVGGWRSAGVGTLSTLARDGTSRKRAVWCGAATLPRPVRQGLLR